MPETRRIFGLAIDEELVWATAETDGNDVINVEETTVGLIEGDDLLGQLHALLEEIGRKELNSFQGFGVSSIGVVDITKQRLVNIKRKTWTRESADYVLDFQRLFLEYITALLLPKNRLRVQNDATCAALAELAAMRRLGSNCDRLLYLTINEGINGGIAYYDRPLETHSSPEMGHILAALRHNDPALYRDGKFDRGNHTGCPVHGRCFEGVASGARIRKSWGGKKAHRLFNLKDLDRDHIAWELVPFYIAQLCMIGALTISPEKIVIGGYIMNEELLPAIKRKFSAMNGDYFFPTYMRREDLIQQSQLSKDANVLGALELARMAAYPEKGHKLSLVRTKQNAR